MGKEIKVSAIILLGEKTNKEILDKCLDSIKWVDEIIKVETSKLAGSFSSWRNIGAERASGEWLFYVDTDEVVTKKLRESILECIKTDKFSAYAIPRRNFIFGKEMKHCGLWPDYVLRLIKKDDLESWQGELHEQPKIKGEIEHLKEPLLHYKHKTLSDMVDKTNEWSAIEAKLMFDANHPKMNIFRFFSAGFREFWHRMIVQTAFMDGTEGVIYGIYQVFSRLISYTKLWEMQLNKQK